MPILFTTTARRRQLELWRERAAHALAKLERQAARAFRAVLAGIGSPAAEQRWKILVARCVFYIQRCDAALAAL